MDSSPSLQAILETFELGDPAIDDQAIAHRIAAALPTRTEAPPASTMADAELAAERLALQASLVALREACAAYGQIRIERGGLAGRLEGWVKKAVKGLLRGPLRQQAEVHDRLLQTLGHLEAVLALQEQRAGR